MTISLGIHKAHPEIILPKRQTEESACFDLAYNPHGKTHCVVYRENNKKMERKLSKDGSVRVCAGERLLAPTGLIFDIPKGYSLRLHPRSGLSLKSGIILANCEAVIDSDYVQETQIMITNISSADFDISVGDRLCQAELVQVLEYEIHEVAEAPKQKTDRTGGLGSTGTGTEKKKVDKKS